MDEVEFLVSEEVFELLDDPRIALDIVLDETNDLQNKERRLREPKLNNPSDTRHIKKRYLSDYPRIKKQKLTLTISPFPKLLSISKRKQMVSIRLLL